MNSLILPHLPSCPPFENKFYQMRFCVSAKSFHNLVLTVFLQLHISCDGSVVLPLSSFEFFLKKLWCVTFVRFGNLFRGSC